MINHGQTRIFSGRNEPVSGRNANIQPNMFKRREIFEKQSPHEKFQTPFSGHSFTGSSMSSIPSVNQSHSLAQSQLAELNTDAIRKLVREEIEKNTLNSSSHFSEGSEESLKNKNELNILKIEVRSIKESYHELNKVIKRRFEEQSDETLQIRKQLSAVEKAQSNLKGQIVHEIDTRLSEYESSISRNMRTLYQKMQEDIITEYKEYSEGSYVPLDFLGSLDEQLGQIEDRISQTEAKILNKKKSVGDSQLQASVKSSSTLTSAAELKLNKLQKQIESLKKNLQEKIVKIKELDEQVYTNKQRQEIMIKENKSKISLLETEAKEQKQGNSDILQKIQTLRKKMFEMIQTEIEAVNRKIMSSSFIQEKVKENVAVSEMANVPDSLSVILDSQNTKKQSETNEAEEESKSTHTSETERQISKAKLPGVQLEEKEISKPKEENAQNQNSSAQKVNSPRINFTYSNDGQKVEKPEKLGKSSQLIQGPQNQLTAQTDTKSEVSDSSSIGSMSSWAKRMYRIDENGYLMDSDSKYILSSSNSMIKVPESKIAQMESSGLLHVEKWERGV